MQGSEPGRGTLGARVAPVAFTLVGIILAIGFGRAWRGDLIGATPGAAQASESFAIDCPAVVYRPGFDVHLVVLLLRTTSPGSASVRSALRGTYCPFRSDSAPSRVALAGAHPRESQHARGGPQPSGLLAQVSQ